MDAKRAQEICHSPNMANVTYNGVLVYIEHVDQQNGVATIHPLIQPGNKQGVAVEYLKEQ